MSKDWVDEFIKHVSQPDDEGYVYVEWDWLKDFIEEALAKQRTQLLKEVREKVIGKYEQVTVMTPPDIDELGKDFRNDFKDKQLKKLKELEEGK